MAKFRVYEIAKKYNKDNKENFRNLESQSCRSGKTT